MTIERVIKTASRASSKVTVPKALCVATPCADVDRFIASYHLLCDDTSIFIPTSHGRPVGLETEFSVCLADRTPVLRGLCRVLEVCTNSDNRWRHPGVRLEITRLMPASTGVWTRLKAHAAVASALTELPLALTELPLETREPVRTPISVRFAAATSPPGPTPERDDAAPAIDAAESSGTTCLPANPLANLEDSALAGFVECAIFEVTSKLVILNDTLLDESSVAAAATAATAAAVAAATAVGPSEPVPAAVAIDESSAPADETQPLVVVRQTAQRGRPRGGHWVTIAAAVITTVGVVAAMIARSESPSSATAAVAGARSPREGAPAPVASRADPDFEDREPDGDSAEPLVSIDAALVHPVHRLTVITRPPGAAISLEGRRVGTTPAEIEVAGFKPVVLTLEKSGWRTSLTRLYSKSARDRIEVPLRKARRSRR